MCFVFIWEQTATCATYTIKWLIFITEMKSVYSAVRTGALNKAVWASSLKGSNTSALRDDINSETDFMYTKAHGAVQKTLQSRTFKVKCREAFSINVWGSVECQALITTVLLSNSKEFALKDNLKTSRNDLPKGVMSFGIQGQRGFPEIFLNKAAYPGKARTHL
jgi:hypothetical protein